MKGNDDMVAVPTYSEIYRLLEGKNDAWEQIRPFIKLALLVAPGMVLGGVLSSTEILTTLGSGVTLMDTVDAVEAVFMSTKEKFKKKEVDSRDTFDKAKLCNTLLVFSAYFDTVRQENAEMWKMLKLEGLEAQWIIDKATGDYSSCQYLFGEDGLRILIQGNKYAEKLTEFYTLLNNRMQTFVEGFSWAEINENIWSKYPQKAVNNYCNQFLMLCKDSTSFRLWVGIQIMREYTKSLGEIADLIRLLIDEGSADGIYVRTPNKNMPNSRVIIKAKQAHLQNESIYGNASVRLMDIFVNYAATRTMGNCREEFSDVINAIRDSCESTPQRFFLLLGDYGVGKSSTLKMLASKYNNGRYVYVPLKDVLLYSNNDTIKSGIVEYCEVKYKLQFQLNGIQDEVVFLLDGFDEIQRIRDDKLEEERLFNQIKMLATYDNVRIVLSSRSTCFINNPHLLDAPTIYLKDFDEEQIGIWIDKWKKVYPDANMSISTQGLKERKLIKICKNKLILYMVARIYNDELKEAREYTKAYVYKCFFDWTIAGKFKEDTDYQSSSYIGTDKKNPQEYRRILQDIALVITQYGKNEIMKVSELKKQLELFQKVEIVDDLFTFSQHLFTRHFFTTKKEGEMVYVEFSLKSLREYAYAEKIYDILKEGVKENKSSLSLGDWYQLGRNKKVSEEVFVFLAELLSEERVEVLLRLGEQMRVRTLPLIADRQFQIFVEGIEDKEKAITNIAEGFYRSIVLATIAGIINNICYDLVMEKYPNRIAELQQVDCETIFSYCAYKSGKKRPYSHLYPVFMRFVHNITLKDTQANNIQYIGLSLKNFQITDSELFRGIIQSTDIENILWCNAHFNLMKMEGVKIHKGVIEHSSFDNCSINNIVFESVHFKDVSFDLLFSRTVKFVNCIFEDMIIENVLNNDTKNRMELNGVPTDELKQYFELE